MKSKIFYTASGTNLFALPYMLARKGITLMDIKKQRASLCFGIYAHQKKQLEQICKDKIELHVQKCTGLLALYRFVLLRPLLFVGLFLSVLVVLAYSQFFWHIKIEGNQIVPTYQIEQMLEDMNVATKSTKSTLNLRQIEQSICEDSRIMAVSCKLVGSTLLISIKEALTHDEQIDLNVRRDIVSDTDGVVKSILVLSGTAKVKVGDAIKKGAVLIEGQTYDKEGIPLRECRAVGEVIVGAFITQERFFAQSYTAYVRSGKVFYTHEISLFGTVIGKRAAQPDFTLYQKEAYTTLAFAQSLLPYKKTRTYYYELVPKQIDVDIEQKCAQLLVEMKQDFLSAHVQDTVLSSTMQITNLQGLIRVSVFWEVFRKFD